MTIMRSIPSACTRYLLPLRRTTPLLAVLTVMLGCGTVRVPFSGVVPGPTFASLTGNWQIAVTPTTGPAPFTSLAGFINEKTNDTASASSDVTASLQLANPSSCYVGTLLIPAIGNLQSGKLNLFSFTVNGQYFDITSTLDTTGASFAGTYVIQNGCAGDLSSQGTLAGTRYSNIKGSYQGALSGSEGAAMTLALTQNTIGNGDGSFFITGTSLISGVSCFSQRALKSTSGTVLGSAVQITFNDPGSNSQVMVTGTFDTAAHVITLTSVDVTGGACAGHLGPASLTLQG